MSLIYLPLDDYNSVYIVVQLQQAVNKVHQYKLILTLTNIPFLTELSPGHLFDNKVQMLIIHETVFPGH